MDTHILNLELADISIKLEKKKNKIHSLRKGLNKLEYRINILLEKIGR